MTAPPPLDLPPWPEITWGGAFFAQPPDGFTSERVAAVAASEAGFVAVGVAEAIGRAQGQIYFSGDGVEWDRVGVPGTLEGVSLLDVAAGPGGFVAIGDVAGDPFLASETGIVLFHSPDGRRWERVPDVPGLVAGLASGIGGGTSGYVALGFTRSGARRDHPRVRRRSRLDGGRPSGERRCRARDHQPDSVG